MSLDLTKRRKGTFYDISPVTHLDMPQPYCPEVRSVLIKTAKNIGESVRDEVVLACTKGPRYETEAEVKILQSFGCDMVGRLVYLRLLSLGS